MEFRTVVAVHTAMSVGDIAINARETLSIPLVKIDDAMAEDAYEALASVDAGKHDRLVLETAEKIADRVELFVLAQGSMANKHEGIYNGRYKLMHFYDLNEWELYDLEADPYEMQSFYDDPEYADIASGLKRELERLKEQYLVP